MQDSENNRVSRRAWIGGAIASAAVAATTVAAATTDKTAAPGDAGTTAPKTNRGKVRKSVASKQRMPVLYLPHGGGPCFFMKWTMGPPDTWNRTAEWLQQIPASLPTKPKALLVVSAHWETDQVAVTTATQPPLLFDYYGFPKHTYELTWPAPGSPVLAGRVRSLLRTAGIASAAEPSRGLDHGVFVPLKVAFPRASVPTVQLSLRRGLDPAQHLAIGKALAPLRDEGVFIVGSGMSYHNMRGFSRPQSLAESRTFDAWLKDIVGKPAAQRDAALSQWAKAPQARVCHPREEHLLPLMVVAGAAGESRGQVDFSDVVMGVQVSAHRFG
ncbi:MAG: dioxygenase [Myxococcales bacterium]|nr:dioxygenase [Myxococcales bacterium]